MVAETKTTKNGNVVTATLATAEAAVVAVAVVHVRALDRTRGHQADLVVQIRPVLDLPTKLN